MESLFDVGSLMAVLHQIHDPRAARGVRYSLATLLILLILAKLAGEDGMKGMSEWVRLRDKQLAKLLNLTRQTMTPLKKGHLAQNLVYIEDI